MILSAIFVTALFQGIFLKTSEADGQLFRDICFINEEEECSTDFVDVYPDLSRAVTGKLADTYWLLYTRKNPLEPERLHKCGGRLPPKSNFNPKKKIVIIALSFESTFCNLEVYREWKDEILEKENVNILAIDYAWILADYSLAHKHLKLAAKQTVVVLDNIKEDTGLDKLNVVVIGISLGAQFAGYIGRFYEVDRIIGLDPAGPSFNLAPEAERLSPNDAKLVDVWHCNAGELGAAYDAGHLNYYINGGMFQEACHTYEPETIAKGDVFYAIGNAVGPSCHHLQCTQYFKETINPGKCQFVGVKCSNWADFLLGQCARCGPNGENCEIMGYDLDKVIREVPKEPQRYWLKTALVEPYCDNSNVDLEGYEDIYKSSLQKKSCKKKIVIKEESFLEDIPIKIKNIFSMNWKHLF